MPMTKWEEIGKALLKGKILSEIKIKNKTYLLNDKQSQFICDLNGKDHKFLLYSGGRGCGKSLALIQVYVSHC